MYRHTATNHQISDPQRKLRALRELDKQIAYFQGQVFYKNKFFHLLNL